MHPVRPDIDEDLIGAEIEILYKYVEPDGSSNNMRCQGIVIALQIRNRIHIELSASTFCEGDE